MSAPSTSKQRGAALIISLILLMVLTVLAISTMRTASLGLLMAGNAQSRENAFQLAMAGIEATLRGGEPVAAPDCDAAIADAPVALAELRGSYTTTVCYRGQTLPSDSSAGLPVYNYEVTSEGATDQRGARSRLVQGFAITGAMGR
jgi:type IV pilus assembly protein PilX